MFSEDPTVLEHLEAYKKSMYETHAILESIKILKAALQYLNRKYIPSSRFFQNSSLKISLGLRFDDPGKLIFTVISVLANLTHDSREEVAATLTQLLESSHI